MFVFNKNTNPRPRRSPGQWANNFNMKIISQHNIDPANDT